MRNLEITDLPYNVPPIEDITDSLPRRKTWEELPKKYIHKGKDLGYSHTGFRDPKDIDTIAIHHSGSPEGSLIQHAEYHARKWGTGIAYHLAIDNGRIYQTNDLRSFTFHVGNHNTYTIGIMVNRDLTKRDLNDQERELLYAAIFSVKAVLPIKHIWGHHEFPSNATTCPGTSMNRIRMDIQSLEEQIQYMNSPNDERARAYSIAERILDLYNKSKEEGYKYRNEAVRKLLSAEQHFRDQGWL